MLQLMQRDNLRLLGHVYYSDVTHAARFALLRHEAVKRGWLRPDSTYEIVRKSPPTPMPKVVLQSITTLVIYAMSCSGKDCSTHCPNGGRTRVSNLWLSLNHCSD